MKKTIYSLTLFLFASTALAQPGSLDLSFDSDGFATADMGDDYSYNLALQSDGKIVMAGYSYIADYDISIARFNTDGSLDNTFSGDGKLTIDFGGFDQFAGQVAIAPDGKIVVAGTTFNGLNNDILVVRVNSDGTIDNTFDGDGIAITDINLSVDYGRDVTVQTDGKIVVAGSTDDVSTLDFAVLRYNTDGTLDNTFDGDGIAITDINSNDDYARSITLQTDGKIIVAGYAYLGFFTDVAAVRYNTDGSLDNTFSFDGKAYTGVGSMDDYGNCVVVQPDGAVVISGYTNEGLYNDFAVVRFTASGILDNTFDSDGVVTTNFDGYDDFSYACALQSDGKIVVVGSGSDGVVTGFALSRYNTDGSLDTDFDTDGFTLTMYPGDAYAQGVAIQADGKIVAGGYYYSANADYIVSRYFGECIVDNGASQAGYVITADAAGATYQWVDCDNGYAFIPGETGQSYTATGNGNFAVIISQNGCSDTSACFNVSGIGFEENKTASISVYPNPANGQITVNIGQPAEGVTVKLLSLTGQVLEQRNNLSGSLFLLDLSAYTNGIYFVETTIDGMTRTQKVVKK
jgi:uncharacterized delta-60 repeat protein